MDMDLRSATRGPGSRHWVWHQHGQTPKINRIREGCRCHLPCMMATARLPENVERAIDRGVSEGLRMCGISVGEDVRERMYQWLMYSN